MVKAIKKYPYIDALRGYAILGVISVHAFQMFKTQNVYFDKLMLTGEKGVQLFYIASAITLFMSWNNRKLSEYHPILNFYIRRIFRIAPLFFVAILLSLLVDGRVARYWAPNGIKLWFIPLTIFFLNGWHPESVNSVIYGGWSIAVEMNFYLILPILFDRINNIKKSIIFICISLIISKAWIYSINTYGSLVYNSSPKYIVHDFQYYSFFGQLPVFAFGILAYHLIACVQFQKNYKFIVAIFVPMPFCFILIQPFLASPSSTIYFATIFTLFSVCMSASLPSCLENILKNRIIELFGKYSFGMYICHYYILRICDSYIVDLKLAIKCEYIFPILCYAFICIASFTLSIILHRLIEGPGIRWGKSLILHIEHKCGKQVSASAVCAQEK